MIHRNNDSLGPDGSTRRRPEWKRRMRFGTWDIKTIVGKEPECVETEVTGGTGRNEVNPTPNGTRDGRRSTQIGCVSFVCVLSCVVFSGGPDIVLTTHIQGGPPLCICLVFWSRDYSSPYRHLTHGHFNCKSLRV